MGLEHKEELHAEASKSTGTYLHSEQGRCCWRLEKRLLREETILQSSLEAYRSQALLLLLQLDRERPLSSI